MGGCDTTRVSDDGERHFNIHTDPETMAGHYANFANVSHSDYEFTITFARVDHEVDEPEVPGVVVSRVNLAPRFMRELIDAMEDNFSKWQTREGIRELPAQALLAGRDLAACGCVGRLVLRSGGRREPAICIRQARERGHDRVVGSRHLRVVRRVA